MAAFSVEDVFVKRAARELPVGQVLAVLGLGGALVFGALVHRARVPLWQAAVWSRSMLVRAVFELVGRLFYFVAVALTPLSAATAILQATPVLVVIGASLYFGERIGWRRWCAVFAGLVGVLIVLRPAAADFSVLSLLTVVGMLGFAGRDLASRAAPASLGTLHLGFYGFITVTLAGLLHGVWQGAAWTMPPPPAMGALAGAVAFGVLAYGALMKAMRTGDLASVTPFRYTRLFFGIAAGVVFFDETIDGPMVLGCLIILAAGLLIAWHGQAVPTRPTAPGR